MSIEELKDKERFRTFDTNKGVERQPLNWNEPSIVRLWNRLFPRASDSKGSVQSVPTPQTYYSLRFRARIPVEKHLKDKV